MRRTEASLDQSTEETDASDRLVARAGALIRDELRMTPAPGGAVRVPTSFRSRSVGSPWYRGRVGFGLACAVALAAAVVLVLGLRDRSLSYRVAGGAGPSADGDYIAVAEASPVARVSFEDGTWVELQPGARGRVVETHEKGAEVALEEGQARVAVRHLPGARWVVRAGPFALHVKGTTFDVSWSAKGQTLEVALHEGALVVVGPIAQRSVTLAGGERLVANVASREINIRELDEPPRAEPTVPAQPAASPLSEPAAPQASARPATSAPSSQAPTWAVLLEAGEAGAVIASAEALGTAGCFKQCSLSDLQALAHAARFTRRPDMARAAFESLRHRFPGTRAAAEAALHLGRLLDDSQGNPRAALGWYARYLEEAPSGPYAPDALGRKMLAERKVLGAGAAKQTARSYLQKYPKGTHARAASELLALPDSAGSAP